MYPIFLLKSPLCTIFLLHLEDCYWARFPLTSVAVPYGYPSALLRLLVLQLLLMDAMIQG